MNRIPLSKIANVKYGKAKPKSEGEFPVIGSCGRYGYSDTPLISYPTIIIGRKGNAGKSWLQVEPSWPSDTTFYLEFIRNDIDLQYLFYYFLSNPLSGEHSKTTIPSLPKPDLENYLVPLPSLEEQQAIARTLRTVQEAQERTEAVIEAANNLKAAMMRHLFTYGPVPIPERESVRMKETDIGLIPEDWEISSINNLCSLIVDCPHSTPIFSESGYLVIRTSHVKNGHLLLDAPSYTDYEGYCNRITRAEPKEGDILLTREAPIGEACVIPNNVKLCLGQRMMLLRPDSAKIDNKFLLYSLYSEQVSKEMKGKGSGVTAPHLNVKEVKKQTIPFPCLSQQRCISQILSQIDEKIEKEQNIKKSLQIMFDGLLMNFMKNM